LEFLRLLPDSSTGASEPIELQRKRVGECDRDELLRGARGLPRMAKGGEAEETRCSILAQPERWKVLSKRRRRRTKKRDESRKKVIPGRRHGPIDSASSTRRDPFPNGKRRLYFMAYVSRQHSRKSLEGKRAVGGGLRQELNGATCQGGARRLERYLSRKEPFDIAKRQASFPRIEIVRHRSAGGEEGRKRKGRLIESRPTWVHSHRSEQEDPSHHHL